MSTSTDILGIQHISIVCANAQRTVDFYTQVLGQHLMLPPWLERNRAEIEQALPPIHSPAWLAPEVTL